VPKEQKLIAKHFEERGERKMRNKETRKNAKMKTI